MRVSFALLSSSTQASDVAPVVITSSISRICFPSRASGATSLNIELTLIHLSYMLLCVCVSLLATLIRLFVSTGMFSIELIPLAIHSDWLYPLFLILRLCSGTGNNRSTSHRGLSSALSSKAISLPKIYPISMLS